MGEAGVLHPDARVELLEGRIIDRSPIGPMHGGIVIALNEFFMSSIRRGRWIVSVQGALRIDEYSEPEPDVILVKPPVARYARRHPQPEDVLLLIEVADSSLAQDRLSKLPIYGRAGIPEVWIVNLIDEVIEVYRDPNFLGYSKKAILDGNAFAAPEAFADLRLEVSTLFHGNTL